MGVKLVKKMEFRPKEMGLRQKEMGHRQKIKMWLKRALIGFGSLAAVTTVWVNLHKKAEMPKKPVKPETEQVTAAKDTSVVKSSKTSVVKSSEIEKYIAAMKRKKYSRNEIKKRLISYLEQEGKNSVQINKILKEFGMSN